MAVAGGASSGTTWWCPPAPLEADLLKSLPAQAPVAGAGGVRVDDEAVEAIDYGMGEAEGAAGGAGGRGLGGEGRRRGAAGRGKRKPTEAPKAGGGGGGGGGAVDDVSVESCGSDEMHAVQGERERQAARGGVLQRLMGGMARAAGAYRRR